MNLLVCVTLGYVVVVSLCGTLTGTVYIYLFLFSMVCLGSVVLFVWYMGYCVWFLVSLLPGFWLV